MKSTHQIVIWTLVCLFALTLPTAVQAEWYNPLSWGSGSSSTKKSKEPSTLQKFNSGTKDFFYKSADFLNPFNDGEEPKKSARNSNYGGNRSGSQKKKEESSWFSGWFSEPEPEPPETVSDFLGLPRAKF